MKNTKFTLIELIAVVVLLGMSIIIMSTITLPKMTNSREKAFRVETTKIVKATEKAIKDYKLSKFVVQNNSDSCAIDERYCFSIKELVNLRYYDGNINHYSGKIEAYKSDDKLSYSVYVKKNDEFKIIAGYREDYTENGLLSIESWNEDYEECNCELNN